MTNTKGFWIVQMVGLTAFYAWAAMHFLQGDSGHRSVLVAAIILGLHVLEVPLAFVMLKGRNAQPLRVIACTLLFGLIWWVPAKRGIFAVN
ncbi:MAG: hypothetical protein Q7J29_02300 [Stagnimonas sp.]|nr:hypothetical protein [Stagnimonas sp.]